MIPNLDKHLQRVFVGKAHEVPAHDLHWLVEQKYVVFASSQYRLTEIGEMRRVQLRKDGKQSNMSVTLGEMIAAKAKR
jgi:hypothetical protein